MTYWAVGCVQKCDLWACQRKEKKGQKLSCVKLAICPDHPRRRRPLKFCMRGRVREVVIYFKFNENRSRGLRAVEGQKSPSPIDLAHGLFNSLYYRTSRDASGWELSLPMTAKGALQTERSTAIVAFCCVDSLSINSCLIWNQISVVLWQVTGTICSRSSNHSVFSLGEFAWYKSRYYYYLLLQLVSLQTKRVCQCADCKQSRMFPLE